MGLEGALLITSVIGLGMSAYGSYREGQDAAEASEYNAKIAEQEAELTRISGALDVSRQRERVSRLVGTQKAITAGSGIELTGSPLDVMIDTAAEGELDAQIIEYNTKARAAGFISQAAYDRRLSDIYATSGAFKAGATLLTQGSKIATSYFGYGYRQPTTTDTES